MKTELNIGRRWEDGTPHHPKSESLYKLISEIDYRFGGDAMGLKAGGDGDNGEALMYALDIIHEAQDNGEFEQLENWLKEGAK